jgi:signal transduction histidine kinase
VSWGIKGAALAGLIGLLLCVVRSLQVRFARYRAQVGLVERRVQSLAAHLGEDSVEDRPLDPRKFTEIPSFAQAISGLETAIHVSLRDRQESSIERGRVETARRAAQELRPPVAALSLILQRLPELNADSIEAAQGALTKIRAVTADLLRASGDSDPATPTEEVSQSEPLLAIIERVIHDRRQKLRDRPRVRIEFGTLPGFPGPFAKVEARALSRVLSDLVDNAVEALIGAEGRVRIDLLEFAQRGFVELRISDDGVGIPQEVIASLGIKRHYAGVARESGHGLYHAFHRIKEWGGQMTLSRKPDRGTLCSIRLPIGAMPAWFAAPIRIPAGARVVILEKDSEAMNVWSNYVALLMRGRASEMPFKLLSRGVDFDAHLRQGGDRPDLCFVSQELGDELVNGLDLIAANRVAGRSILVAAEFENRALRRRADRLGVRILPKELIEAAIGPEIRHLLRGLDPSPELRLGLMTQYGSVEPPSEQLQG